MWESNRDRRSTKCSALHQAITIYYSSTEISTEIKVKQNFIQELRFSVCMLCCGPHM